MKKSGIEIGYAYDSSDISRRINKGFGTHYISIDGDFFAQKDFDEASATAKSYLEKGFQLNSLYRHCLIYLTKSEKEIDDYELLKKYGKQLDDGRR